MDHSDQRQQSTHQNQHQQQQQPGAGSVAATTQMAYATPPPYQTLPIVATGTPAAATVSSPTSFAPQQQLAFHQAHHFHTQQQQQQLQAFWASQMQEIEQTTDFKNHTLPLARIKKIMKADEDVRMISAEAPVIFAKACEMFILELTLRSWIHTEENKRRTLQKNDIAAAISRTDVFDFLVDIIPRDELKEEGLGITKAGIPLVGSGGDGLPYYYVPPQAPVGTNGMIMGKPVDHQAALYAGQQHRAALPFMPWPHSHAQQPPPSQQQPSDS
ncbi:hypothetical protein BUALT_Bualt03G0170400 [Buddleja alternifolia]|uniref:Core Histone H2A/H2B/H3 domain-containing protein n=1 Tax=Buddleja alternifolia TaxID=168488 RepID=A0AAV6Y2J8_9LAMI|nr:hypothetical protein BUALT_Bualt03G0170400 [Buddleja alternifolia]